MCLFLVEMLNGILYFVKICGYVFVIKIFEIGERMWNGCLVNYFVFLV